MGFNVVCVKVKMLLRDAQDVKVNGIVIEPVRLSIGLTIKVSVKPFMKK